MKGPVAQAIVDVVHSLGGLLTLEDLKAHESTIDTPISVNYRGMQYTTRNIDMSQIDTCHLQALTSTNCHRTDKA